ncbi:MAG: phage SPO1 DNA polymerase-related protein [candidate division WS6 bacterium GW2011_GWF2_39_15]|uniref:Phage SPO1 DNA polymerase-related protein n=1 Tax=candidate division WS6 bacterium GW2011_GWF2_39_15 TaxID=1619100 RepID=A0A0G0MRC7_9BACT|nr:MAG: phage SPO1 DNA polymerase-related protein [candidate division WS6 bacterium GW2011_GWF2_39_15]
MKQVLNLHDRFDDLQVTYGDQDLKSIYGAGETNHPKLMFIFMNPTGKNIASSPNWQGLRAPWLGTKPVWKIFHDLNLLDTSLYFKISALKPTQWDKEFAHQVYTSIAEHSVYITNLAKCTLSNARPLNNKVFKDYLDLVYEEIEAVTPQKIVSFGNQVSSILLKKQISVSLYPNDEYEFLKIKSDYQVFPTYYPVGQGKRNMPKAINRIARVLEIPDTQVL